MEAKTAKSTVKNEESDREAINRFRQAEKERYWWGISLAQARLQKFDEWMPARHEAWRTEYDDLRHFCLRCRDQLAADNWGLGLCDACQAGDHRKY